MPNCKIVVSKGLKNSSFGFGEDALLRGLFEALGTSVSLASLFCLPSLLSLFEGEHPAWQATDTSRLRRSAWPLLKDPDSLLTIQLIIRCFLVSQLLRYGVAKMRVACGQSVRSRAFSSAAAVLFLAAYGAKMFLYQYPLYRLEGPMGGMLPMLVEATTAVMLLCILGGILSSLRMPEAVGALLVAPCIMSALFGIASANYLEVDPAAGQIGNAAFTLSELMDTAACLALLLGPGLGTSGRPSFISYFLAPVLIFEQALGLYYFLDSLEKSPQSTLSFGAQLQEEALAESDEQFEIMQLPMHGKPEELLLTTQSIEFAVVILGMLLYAVRIWRTSSRTSGSPSHKEQKLDLEMASVHLNASAGYSKAAINMMLVA